MEKFLNDLSSKEPVPGGGGASALVGAIGCALCSMVGNLTTGKKKYADYQDRLNELLPWLEAHREVLLADIKKDADAFYPLSQAYSLDKNDPATEGIMEKALYDAANAPMQIIEDVYALVPILVTDSGSVTPVRLVQKKAPLEISFKLEGRLILLK